MDWSFTGILSVIVLSVVSTYIADWGRSPLLTLFNWYNASTSRRVKERCMSAYTETIADRERALIRLQMNYSHILFASISYLIGLTMLVIIFVLKIPGHSYEAVVFTGMMLVYLLACAFSLFTFAVKYTTLDNAVFNFSTFEQELVSKYGADEVAVDRAAALAKQRPQP